MKTLIEMSDSPPREAVAVIVFDSLTEPFAGARGPKDARRVVSRCEDLDIHLKISSDPSEHRIVGQVFARNSTQFFNNVRVQLLQDGTPFETTSSDNFGQFEFNAVPCGLFRIQIDLPHLTLVSGITIGEQR